MKRRLLCLLSLLCAPHLSWALSMEETPNPQAPAHEALTSMRAMRGQGIRDHALTITAMAAEAWSVTVENLPGVTV